MDRNVKEEKPGENSATDSLPARGARKKAARATLIGAPGEPPPWAVAVMIGIIGLVVFIFELANWWPGLFPESSYFYVGLIALPMVALVILAAVSKLIELRQAQSWSQTTGKVVRSEIAVQRHRFAGEEETIKNMPTIEYEFAVFEKKIRGSRIGIGDDSGGANTEATLARYPLGATVTVYYDPANPTHCVLERSGPQGVNVKATGCLRDLVVLAGLAFAVYWLIRHGSSFIDAKFPNAQTGAVVFAACFGLVTLLLFIGGRRYSKQAANWPSVRGSIVSSRVESYQERDAGGTMRTNSRPAVEFSYAVRGQEYHSRQIKLAMTVSGSQSYAAGVTAKYPEGSEVDVHYDPANPSTAALENPTGAPWIVALIALFCFGVAIYALGIFK